MSLRHRAQTFSSSIRYLFVLGLVAGACAPNRQVNETSDLEDSDIKVGAISGDYKIELGPVELREYSTNDIADLDPQMSESFLSRDVIESLFVQLTNLNQSTAKFVPEAAESWEISEDGLVYTFYLRSDIPWVQHDPETGETSQAIDGEGNLKFVSAQDFVNATYRACDPNLAAYYSFVIAPLIKGCSELLNTEDPALLVKEDFNAVGVEAIDKTTIKYSQLNI